MVSSKENKEARRQQDPSPTAVFIWEESHEQTIKTVPLRRMPQADTGDLLRRAPAGTCGIQAAGPAGLLIQARLWEQVEEGAGAVPAGASVVCGLSGGREAGTGHGSRP